MARTRAMQRMHTHVFIAMLYVNMHRQHGGSCMGMRALQLREQRYCSCASLLVPLILVLMAGKTM